ncbi:MAG TPA: T9SS type A sorting domain-containing protein [Bacteroidia bacterium]|nr:T9SS type A sorting domain-containing protein [Bacteroidia bacterium]
MENEGSYEDLQTVFSAYINLGEPDSASAKLEQITNLDDAETDWMDISGILLSLTTNSKTWFEMDSTQEASVRDIAAEEGSSLAKIQAQNVLRMVYRDTFPDYVDEEEYYNRMQPEHSLHSLYINNELSELTVFPNPANDEVTIKLKNPSPEIYNIVVYDVTGRKQFETNCRINNTGKTFHVSNLVEGIYFIKLSDNKKKNLTTKLVISR